MILLKVLLGLGAVLMVLATIWLDTKSDKELRDMGVNVRGQG